MSVADLTVQSIFNCQACNWIHLVFGRKGPSATSAKSNFGIERGKREFDCDKQSVNSGGSSPQSCTKGSEERIIERSDRKN